MVGLTATVNLYDFLQNHGFDPETVHIKSAVFVYHGLHSGKRSDQQDNVELVVNGKIYPIVFKSNNVREEELVSVPIVPESLNISQIGTNRFTIIVLPYQEKYPVLPPESGYEKHGPGHFRDIELWKGNLILTVD